MSLHGHEPVPPCDLAKTRTAAQGIDSSEINASLEQTDISLTDRNIRNLANNSADSPVKVSAKIKHEHNSDHGTHLIISDILQSGFLPDPASEYSKGQQLSISTSDLVSKLLPSLKRRAEENATVIASRAILRVTDQSRRGENIGLSDVLTEVLLDSHVRRGSAPSDAGKEDRSALIHQSLVDNNELCFAVLILPRRDNNPAKNDGQLPDLGKVSTLLRLWTIGKAISIAKEHYEQPRVTLLNQVAEEPLTTAREALTFLSSILTKKSPEEGESNDYEPLINNIVFEARRTKERITRNIESLGKELRDYSVYDEKASVRLLLTLARNNQSLQWLFEGLEFAHLKPTKILAV